MEVRVLAPGSPAGEKPEFIRRGRGGTKKAAEQDAARKALELLRAATEAPAERTAGADQP